MKTKKSTIYVAEDGKEFTILRDCELHEAMLKEEEKTTSYWRVVYKPDLTEGRGFYGLMYVKISKIAPHEDPKVWLADYCFRTIGRPIAFIQGCSSINNWEIQQSTRELYLKGGKISVGDYSYDSTSLDLIAGEREVGLIERAK
jgi:hypothetical protein